MTKTFVYSDPHFSHAGVCRFLQSDGVTPLRPWDDPKEMDEALVEYYNETVAPEDKVYFLGDVVINRKGLKVLSRLNGRKVLIKGNHDIFKLEDYIEHFYDIRAYHVLNNIMFSHIPIHPQQQGRFFGNVHGHLHSNIVTKIENGQVVPDTFYKCVCVEQTNFRPVNIEEIFDYYRDLGKLAPRGSSEKSSKSS